GVRLHVHFMAAQHGDRKHWFFDSNSFGFSHTLWRDLGITIKGKAWHFNPGLVAALRRRPPMYLMVGGPWDSITGLLASVLPRRSVSIAWFEGNTKTPGRVGGPVGVAKRRLLARYHIWAVPGQE